MANGSQTIDMGASMETLEALEIIDALNEVSDVLAMAGSQVTFVGTAAAAVDVPDGDDDLAGANAYVCPRGWLILLRARQGAHRCAYGADVQEALRNVAAPQIRAGLERELRRRGYA